RGQDPPPVRDRGGPRRSGRERSVLMAASESDPQIEALLEFVRANRGFDFTTYKRPTLVRRLGKRMHEVGTREYGEYLDYLEVHPEEFPRLFDTLLINVTSFLRDSAAWEYLGREIVPRILAAKKSN